MIKNWSTYLILLVALLQVLLIVLSLIRGETTVSDRYYFWDISGVVRIGDKDFWPVLCWRALWAGILFYLFYQRVKPDDDQTF